MMFVLVLGNLTFDATAIEYDGFEVGLDRDEKG